MLDTNTTVIHALDAEDPLNRYRDLFHHGDSDLIYLDGNSLGRLPRVTINHMRQVVRHEWGEDLIRGWNKGWFEIQEKIGNKIAKLIGADEGEVVIADSTTVNLYRLALAAVQHQREQHRTRIVTDDLNFPSDVYVFQAIVDQIKGSRLEIIPSKDTIHGPTTDLIKAIDDHTALLSLSHTVFKSGYTYDMAEITAKAHDAGALVLWDLSHSVGALPIELRKARVDLAVGCCYKYLNGGPGAPAFLYVRKELQDKLGNPLSGWFSQNNMFDMELDYEPLKNIRRFLSGTPPILSVTAIEPSVDMFLEVGMDAVRKKSVGLTDLLIHLYDQHLEPLGFRLNSPRNEKYRGSHISLGHDEGWRINQALIKEMNVLPDFRPPDNIRLGFTPLYTSYVDVHTAVMRLRQIMLDKLYEKYSEEKPAVT
ncbi:MAG: kynureninase [Chloroflexota bacterium]